MKIAVTPRSQAPAWERKFQPKLCLGTMTVYMAANFQNQNITLKARYLSVNFIGLAMIAAVFAYAGVVEVIKWQWSPFTGFAKLPPQYAVMLKYIFLVLAAAQYIIIKVLQKIILAQSVDNLPQAAIVTFALCETVAIFGLILFLLTGNGLDFYVFMVISLGFFYLFFPKYEQWERAVSAATPPKKPKK